MKFNTRFYLTFSFSANEINILVLANISAVAGGGVFGDHFQWSMGNKVF